MLEMKNGIDILSGIGKINNIDDARSLFEKKLDAVNLGKLNKIKNEEALLKIANAISLGQPDKVIINDGSPEDCKMVRQMALEKGEEKPLAMKDHTIHFDLAKEQARLVDRTFYIVNQGEPTSSLAKKMDRKEAYDYIEKTMGGMMKGLNLIVGFYSRGPVGAKASVPAIEITTSTYVCHSADILYRNIFDKFDSEVERRGYFFTNVHSEGPNRTEDLPNARIFMDRSWQTTFSMLCTYAGNTLLLKKGNHRFAVDMASFHQVGSEVSEHMFITGLRGPGDRLTYFAGAAPSGCGKTTTAMVGSDFIGDDLAQLWIADDGTLRAINPEKGIFGIVKDVNQEGDPLLMKSLRQEGAEVIWSNVLIDDKQIPHWEGNGEETPQKGINFQGEWTKGKKDADGKDIPISHANARCTLECVNMPNYAEKAAESPEGVHVKVVTYSGRDNDTMPSVWVAHNAVEGVILGASIVSRATATEVGVTGVRRQPWANQPFIPGGLGEYMQSQIDFYNSNKFSDKNKPLMAGLNYFLTHESRGGKGQGLLGEKRDVKVWLGWLERRASGDVDAIETPIGLIPQYKDLKELFLSEINKEYPKDLHDRQFAFYVDNIVARIDMQKEAWGKESNLPEALFKVYDKQKQGLLELKEKYGAVVSVENLIEANN